MEASKNMNMKTKFIRIAASVLFTAAVFFTSSASAAEGLLSALAEGGEVPSASAEMAALSKYVWRGFELSDDSLVLQPSITVGYKNFSFNLWGNLDTDIDSDAYDNNKFNETDMTLSYAKSFGKLNMDFGYIYYALDALEDSEELYLSLGIDTFFSPTITVYREIAHLPSWYITFDLSYSFELPKDITLDLSGSIGYLAYDNAEDGSEVNNDLIATGNDYSNFHNGLVSLGLTIPVNKYCSIAPMIAYSFPLTDDAHDFLEAANSGAGFSNDTDYVYGGVTMSIEF